MAVKPYGVLASGLVVHKNNRQAAANFIDATIGAGRLWLLKNGTSVGSVSVDGYVDANLRFITPSASITVSAAIAASDTGLTLKISNAADTGGYTADVNGTLLTLTGSVSASGTLSVASLVWDVGTDLSTNSPPPAPTPAPPPAPNPAPGPAQPCTLVNAPSAVQTMLATPSNPIVVPNDFLGLHVGVDVPTWERAGFGASTLPVPDYPFSWVRTLNAGASGGPNREVEICSWANIETSPGVYNWGATDRWMNSAQLGGRPVVWDVFMTPIFYVKPEWQYEPTPWPSWPGVAAPPERQFLFRLANFVQAVRARYPGRIKAFSIWNEPLFDFRTANTVYDDSGRASNAFTSTGVVHGGRNVSFYRGSATQLVNIAATVKANAGGIPVWGYEFEGPYSHTTVRVMNAPTDISGISGKGSDFIDAFCGHFYDFSDDMRNGVAQVSSYRSQAPAMSGKPFYITEGGAWVNSTATKVGRWHLVLALARVSGVAIFGHLPQVPALSHTANLGRNQADTVAAMNKIARLPGQTICNGATLNDGRVWATTSTGEVFLF